MPASSNNHPLRVLLVEDSAEDAEQMSRALRELGRPVLAKRVASETELRTALTEFVPHVVLSDYSMPGFGGHEALKVVRAEAPQLPFIFVSGAIGEEAAIDALQCGAVDYVLKENLRRLSTAVQNALRTAAERDELVRTERALRESEERFRVIVESTEDWVWEMALDGRLIYSNRSVADLLGFTVEELIGRDVLDLMIDEDAEEVRARLPELVAARRGWRNWLLRWRHREGGLRWLESTAQPLFEEDALIGFRGIDRDVTLRIQQQEKIRQLARIHAVLSELGNAILRARETRLLLDLACRLAVEQGQFKAAAIAMPNSGNRLSITNHWGDRAVTTLLGTLGPVDLEAPQMELQSSAQAFITGQKQLCADYTCDNVPSALHMQMARVGVGAQCVLPIGNPPWAVLQLFCTRPQEFDEEEIALLERIAAELDYARDFIAKSERLEYLAYRDPVSGLPNRAAFENAMSVKLADSPVLVGAIGLAKFSQIGESRGRSFGDQLLTALGQRLAECFDGWLFAHSGGPTFLFAETAPEPMPQCLQQIEQRLLRVSQAPLVLDGEQIHVSLRCGLALSPDHEHVFEALERNTLAALAEATRRELVVLDYSEDLRLRATRRLLLERDLRFALDEQQFLLLLQPKFDARSQRLSGAEALLRWRHPQQGLISPAEFVPLLEETGLIISAGRWVMSTTLELLRRWREQGLGEHRIAINVSARELREQSYVDACRELLQGYHHNHGLDVEITESLLMEDIRHNVCVLSQLRDLGCRIAIDDFGTGYSSLNYLSRLPADVLKIDQSFTSQIAHNPDTLALVTNIIGLAHSLNLKVVAEGVEEDEQDKLLRLLRCDELQGYLLGRPMPIEDFERQFLQ